jgi:tetratricopeptide (TPR) repeat protein
VVAYREAADLARQASSDSALAVAELGRGHALVLMDEPDSAEAALRRGVQILTRIGTDSDEPFLNAATALAGILRRRGDLAGAEMLYRRVVEQRRATDNPHALAIALNNLAVVLRMKEDYGGAAALYRDSWEILSDLFGPGHPTTLMIGCNLGSALQRGGRNDEAIDVFRGRVSAARAQWPEGHWETARTLMELGATLLRTGRPHEALEPLNEALEAMIIEIGPLHSWTHIYRGWVAAAAKAAGYGEDAERSFNDSLVGLAGYERLTEDVQVLGMIEPLAQTLDQYGMTEEAARYRALAAGDRWSDGPRGLAHPRPPL